MGLAEANAKIIARTNEIIVGEKYFLSSFYDKDGCWVKVLSKSTEKNRAGWPSKVEYEIVEPVGGDIGKPYFAPGTIDTCNATNLYEKREMASHTAKRSAR